MVHSRAVLYCQSKAALAEVSSAQIGIRNERAFKIGTP